MSVLIVLGGPLTTDNKPGIWLKSRLDKTIKVYKEYNFDYYSYLVILFDYYYILLIDNN